MTVSPISTPSAARFALLMPMQFYPPMTASILADRFSMLTRTGARFPPRVPGDLLIGEDQRGGRRTAPASS